MSEVINQNRKRHDEARALARQAQQAQTIKDIGLPIREDRTPLSLIEAYNRVTDALAKKCAKRTYPVEIRAELDALVCIQLVEINSCIHIPFHPYHLPMHSFSNAGVPCRSLWLHIAM